jgi:serine/threonine-protein kinase RsbT
MADEAVRVVIASDADLVPARAEGRALAIKLGFTRTDATLIATAISEIARNIVTHVGKGEVEMKPLYEDRRYGFLVIARDSGPGIRDLDSALQHGHASRGGLGLGLPGARRLMDEFHVISDPDTGTTVTMTKWRNRDELELIRERRASTRSD